MSQFDSYTTTQYVHQLRRFLKLRKTNFVRAAGLTTLPATGRTGRLPGYCNVAIEALEFQTNQKATQAESSTVFAERLSIARDYKNLSNAKIARLIGVSREMTRLWFSGTHCCKKYLPILAEILGVPERWLEVGDESNLPADSHIGVRVGMDSLTYRERLYQMTIALLGLANWVEQESEARALIEQTTKENPEIATVARRAGGRWLPMDGRLLFVPWIPIVEHGLSRRYWSDEVESMIEAELEKKSSVYGAWHALKSQCDAMGLSQDKFPRLVTLHKRIAKERERAKQYGIRLRT